MQLGEDLFAMPTATDKPSRLSIYRSIAAYPICKWCLDEIADDFIHDDDNGDFIKLQLPQRLDQTKQNIIQNEFKKFINLFNFRDEGFNLVRRFLVEGELAWENVIKPDYPKMGIVGVRFLPAAYYETLIDTDTQLPVGIVFDSEQYSQDRRQIFSNTCIGSAAIFNAISPQSYTFNFAKNTCVPLLMNQITYITSVNHSDDYTIQYPLIEDVKQQYHRLALLEDSAIILRVTRAPERLLFNISTGQMTQQFADEYVRRFANELKSKKVATPDGEDINGVYNPVTMLKNYVFGRSDGNEGTSVESVGSSANYDQMEDIEYFLRALLKQFKVPWSRWKTPENTMEKNDAINYEEYAFSRMIMRFQRRFADGFKRSFITHLKLRGIWSQKDYELIDSDIDVEFVKPVLYDLYQSQKLVDAKMQIYHAFADADEISKIICLKKYLGFSDKDVQENYTNIIKEKQLIAIGDYFADQISEDNPPVDFKSPIRLKKDQLAQDDITGVTVPAGKPGEEGEKGEDGGGKEDAGGDGTQGLEPPAEQEGGSGGGDDNLGFGMG